MRMCKLEIPVLQHVINVQGGVDNDLLNPTRKETMNRVRKEMTLRIWHSIPGNIEPEEDNIEPEEDNIEE